VLGEGGGGGVERGAGAVLGMGGTGGGRAAKRPGDDGDRGAGAPRRTAQDQDGSVGVEAARPAGAQGDGQRCEGFGGQRARRALRAVASVPSSSQSSSPPTGTPWARRLSGTPDAARRSAR